MQTRKWWKSDLQRGETRNCNLSRCNLFFCSRATNFHFRKRRRKNWVATNWWVKERASIWVERKEVRATKIAFELISASLSAAGRRGFYSSQRTLNECAEKNEERSFFLPPSKFFFLFPPRISFYGSKALIRQTTPNHKRRTYVQYVSWPIQQRCMEKKWYSCESNWQRNTL